MLQWEQKDYVSTLYEIGMVRIVLVFFASTNISVVYLIFRKIKQSIDFYKSWNFIIPYYPTQLISAHFNEKLNYYLDFGSGEYSTPHMTWCEKYS